MTLDDRLNQILNQGRNITIEAALDKVLRELAAHSSGRI